MGLIQSTLASSPSNDESANPETRNLKLDAPVDDSPLQWKLTTHKPIDSSEAIRRLRECENTASWPIPGSASRLVRTDFVRVASLSPVEDDLAFGEIDAGDGTKWSYWGVFDGHSGWATSAVLRDVLAGYVGRELRKLNQSELHSPQFVKKAMDSAFVRLDNEILDDARKALNEEIPPAEAVCRIAPASSGSCATLVLLDPTSQVLHVACVGDSRAVLGRLKQDDGWTALALSTDQTGFNQDEIKRINAEHPGENPVNLDSGRVLNCAVTRSFGDNRWKWPLEDLDRWTEKLFGRNSLSNYHTPPYLTAEPVVTHTEVKPGDLIILASDGFWNHMESNEDAIYCAGLWVDREASQDGVRGSEKGEQSGPARECGPWPYNWTVNRRFFVADGEKNLATHMMKNAFGGSQDELLRCLMSTKAPDAKEARDDATVVAIRF